MKKTILFLFVVFVVIVSETAFCLSDVERLSLRKQHNPFLSQLPIKEVEESVDKFLNQKKREKMAPVQREERIIPRPIIRRKPVLAKPVQPPKMDVKGLIWNSDRPQAIINDRVVDVGDQFQSAKIIAIKRSGVDILFEGKTITLNP